MRGPAHLLGRRNLHAVHVPRLLQERGGVVARHVHLVVRLAELVVAPSPADGHARGVQLPELVAPHVPAPDALDHHRRGHAPHLLQVHRDGVGSHVEPCRGGGGKQQQAAQEQREPESGTRARWDAKNGVRVSEAVFVIMGFEYPTGGEPCTGHP